MYRRNREGMQQKTARRIVRGAPGGSFFFLLLRLQGVKHGFDRRGVLGQLFDGQLLRLVVCQTQLIFRGGQMLLDLFQMLDGGIDLIVAKNISTRISNAKITVRPGCYLLAPSFHQCIMSTLIFFLAAGF